MLTKNWTNRNKLDNKAKIDIKNIDFMPFIQNNIKTYRVGVGIKLIKSFIY